MSVRSWKALLALLGVMVVVPIVAASASSSSASLRGSWSGSIVRAPGGKGSPKRLRLVIKASQRGGSWSVSARCRGSLKLKDISNGYHHYIEQLAPRATCLGGGIDCLKRVGADVYDEFQPQPRVTYFKAGTFKRVA